MIAKLLAHAGNVRCHDSCNSSKKKLLENLSALLANNAYNISAHRILQALVDRERLGSTDLGRGVAIPHARLTDLSHAIAAMITLATPIDYDTTDNQPVDIVYGLLVPSGDGHHLNHLAALAALFRQDKVCRIIRDTSDPVTLFNLLASY